MSRTLISATLTPPAAVIHAAWSAKREASARISQAIVDLEPTLQRLNARGLQLQETDEALFDLLRLLSTADPEAFIKYAKQATCEALTSANFRNPSWRSWQSINEEAVESL